MKTPRPVRTEERQYRRRDGRREESPIVFPTVASRGSEVDQAFCRRKVRDTQPETQCKSRGERRRDTRTGESITDNGVPHITEHEEASGSGSRHTTRATPERRPIRIGSACSLQIDRLGQRVREEMRPRQTEDAVTARATGKNQAEAPPAGDRPRNQAK